MKTMTYIAALLLFLASCGDDGGGGSPSGETVSPPPPPVNIYDGSYSAATTTGTISFSVSDNSISGRLRAIAWSTDNLEHTSGDIYPSGALNSGYYSFSRSHYYPPYGINPGWTETSAISIQIFSDGSFFGTANGSRLIRARSNGGAVMRVAVMGYFTESFSGARVAGSG